jgi:hypothetical protein
MNRLDIIAEILLNSLAQRLVDGPSVPEDEDGFVYRIVGGPHTKRETLIRAADRAAADLEAKEEAKLWSAKKLVFVREQVIAKKTTKRRK